MTPDTLKRKKGNSLPKFTYTIDPNMRDYSKEPFFVKKYESALRSLVTRGTPDMRPVGSTRGAM